MFDLEGKWPNKVEQTGSTLGLSEIQTAGTRSTPIFPNLRLQLFRIFSKLQGFKNSEIIFCYGSSFSDIAFFQFLVL